MLLHDQIAANIGEKDGHLTFAGQDVTALAAQYGTPLYLMDEDRLRANCRLYTDTFARLLGEGHYRVLYASKACSFKQMYRIMAEEHMGIDVVSCGEIATAHAAGYDLSRAYFHSNNKTDADIAYAMDRGIGYFVADNAEEVIAVEAEAARRGVKQNLILRLTPGIDPHTYEAISTGKVDSKFGTAIETGQAEEITAFTLRQPHIALKGFHCHIGSQVFGEDVYERGVKVMLEFIAMIRGKYGYTAEELDMGGGFGVPYVLEDGRPDTVGRIEGMVKVLRETCEALGLPIPVIAMEPGRGIVADAGMTLYSAGTVKRITGYKNYVSIDGGMTDNPRYALYGAKYTVLPASRMDAPRTMVADVVGRCCESGDIIQPAVSLPGETCRGDIIAVCTTGAYNYSMASNYNRIGRPPVVMLKDGTSYVAVRRETVEDVCALDV